ncbi:MAG: hypothetical protein CSA54_01430 [Gammaproteobacteria bacterium]|nr:MAG: hypothetical protein CSA54_01430 [Gammaproteobacteria bacterium]
MSAAVTGNRVPAAAPKPLRIAFVIEALTVGGAEKMLVAMANALAARGHHVHMICLSTAGELASDLDEAVVLDVLDKQRGLDRRLPGRLRRRIREIAPDVVNAHLWVANLWTRVALFGMRSPVVVVTEHSRDSWKPTLYRVVDRLLARRTARLVAVSADTAAFYRDEIGIAERRIVVINNGVDTERYAAGNGTALRQEWLGVAAETARLIGTVGRLVPAKNHPRLLEVMKMLATRHPAWRLVIVGDGPERSAIEAQVQRLGLADTVILAGQRSDIPDVLAALDVFVLSSDREGHPLTALEAQAAGTPVVLTEVGGARDALAFDRDSGATGGEVVPADTSALRPTRGCFTSFCRHDPSGDLRRCRACRCGRALPRRAP